MCLSSRHEHKGYRLKLISINICTTPKSFLGVSTGDGQRRIKIPKEVEQLNGFSLVNLKNDSILLIGGGYIRGSRYSGPSEPNRVIWQGTLADKNTKMEWDRIDIGGSWMGYNSICFKLKDNIYITTKHRKHCSSGKNCLAHSPCPSCIDISGMFDRYNYKEKKMYLNAFSIPVALYKIIHAYAVKIATDKDETLAVFVLKQIPPFEGRMGCVLIFTEKDGFVNDGGYEHSLQSPVPGGRKGLHDTVISPYTRLFDYSDCLALISIDN